jgi:hypothetical protein
MRGASLHMLVGVCIIHRTELGGTLSHRLWCAQVLTAWQAAFAWALCT